MAQAPWLLRPLLVERVWGRRDVEDWVGPLSPADDRLIGEAWLTHLDCEVVGGGTLGSMIAAFPGATRAPPLLAKLLFTAEALSVQVHPTDPAAAAAGATSGKDEAWHILEAVPGAMVWTGLDRPVPVSDLRAAAADGSIMSMLRPHAAVAGDTIMIPAGTVHAIGAGLVVLEVQDPVDVTYRLYDHGRSRPLQVEAALSVSDMGSSRAVVHGGGTPGAERQVLATAPRFVLERCDVSAGLRLLPDGDRAHILVALTPGIMLDGRALTRGLAAFAPVSGGVTRITGLQGGCVALLHGGPGPTPSLAIG